MVIFYLIAIGIMMAILIVKREPLVCLLLLHCILHAFSVIAFNCEHIMLHEALKQASVLIVLAYSTVICLRK